MDTSNKDCASPHAHAAIPDVAVSPIEPDFETLRAYTQAKLALASQLRVLREAFAALGREHGVRQCGELMVKLAEDRFTLAVLGQFKRGKSSLMNAIIGREILPTGVLPLTSANRKEVKTACVELPLPFLRRGIEFVDTPGVGSAITANTATTYGFLPECDAVLFLASVDTPMTSVEVTFLKEIREYVDKIFFVVNKTDLLTDAERDEVLGFVVGAIRAQVGCDDVRVFPVSARLGLGARISGEAALYEQSGVEALKEALAAFLSEEKAAAFLAAWAQKALRVWDEEADRGALGEATLQARAREIRSAGGERVLREPHAAAAAARKARELAALYAAICGGCWLTAETVPATAPAVRFDAAPPESAMDTPVVVPTPAKTDLEADLHTRGCPVCRHITEQAADFFANWQYRIATEAQAQAEFAAELGFCPLHTWQLLAVSSPHGASVGYARLVQEVAHRLRAIATASGAWLAAFMEDAAERRLYQRSEGVCLRHLGLLVEAVSTDACKECLLSHAVQRFEDDAKDMQTYAMKHEALRRGLRNRNEEDAYRRAVIRIVGGRNVCVPWAEDVEI